MFSALSNWQINIVITLSVFILISLVVIMWQKYRRSKRIDPVHTPTVWQVSTSPAFDTTIKPNPAHIPARMYPPIITYDYTEDTFEDTIDDDHLERSKFLADSVAEAIDTPNESHESETGPNTGSWDT